MTKSVAISSVLATSKALLTSFLVMELPFTRSEDSLHKLSILFFKTVFFLRKNKKIEEIKHVLDNKMVFKEFQNYVFYIFKNRFSIRVFKMFKFENS